jgi:EpsD family peptidyl-prolyl cis-trans isomerase
MICFFYRNENIISSLQIMKKITSLFVILLFAIIAGCSHQASNEPDGGVAAMVNGVEITKRQVEYLYQRSAMPGMSEEQSANMKRRILADLIRVELLAGKGREMKLDNTPDYSMALYTAQKNVLAGFAEKKIAGNQSSISADQAESVVLNTPQLFAGRKLFVYDEVIFPGVDMPLLESLDEMASDGAPLSRLLDELRTKKIPFNKTLIALTSEKIPSQILSILNQIKPNIPQIVARNGSKTSMILLLRDTYPAPVEGDPAKRAAMSMIAANQRNFALSKTMNELLDNAKITYYDEYAQTAEGNKKLSPLPHPDTKKAAKKIHNKILLASGLSASFILAVMMVTAVMRTFYSMSWLPKLWFGSTTSAEQKRYYDIRKTATLPRRLYLFGVILLIAAVLILEVLFLWNKLPILAILACFAGGIIAGVIASRLLNVGIVRGWSRKTYTIIASLLALMTLFDALATIKMSSL